MANGGKYSKRDARRASVQKTVEHNEADFPPVALSAARRKRSSGRPVYVEIGGSRRVLRTTLLPTSQFRFARRSTLSTSPVGRVMLQLISADQQT